MNYVPKIIYVDGMGWKPAAVGVGHKHLSAIVFDGIVKLVKVPHDALRSARPLMYRDKPYPATRFTRMMKSAARRCGSTKAAKQAISQIGYEV